MVFIAPTVEPNANPYYIDANTNYLLDDNPLLVQDLSAIANQVYNILSTDIGERIFEPEFGSNLKDFVFGPTDDTTAWLIEGEIVRALGRWMPRIEIIRNQTFAVPYPDERYFDVEIRYRILGLDVEDSLRFQFNQAQVL